MFTRLATALLVLAAALSASLAQTGVSFHGKTITMIIPSAPGGGTDTSGRLIAQYLVRFLPDQPALIAQNIPGAEGIVALNYFVQQVAPDGLTITMGTSSLADPVYYRKSQSHFDPTTFEIIGGVGRGGTMLLINKDSEKRLYDKSLPPVIVGQLVGVPRSGMQSAAWGIQFLGWNAKWVVGYPGTNELMLALERGEIDMTATADFFEAQKIMKLGRFDVLAQSGSLIDGHYLPRPEFPDAPIFADLMAGKISDPVQAKAFAFWTGISAIDKWLALPPKTPAPYVEAYRAAFEQLMKNPEFVETGKNISEDFAPQLHQDVEGLLRTVGDTPPEAIDFTSAMLRRQGLEVD